MKIKVKCKESYDYYKSVKGVLADIPKDNLEKKVTFIEGEIYEVENLTDIGMNVFALYEKDGRIKYVNNDRFDKLFEIIA